MAHPAPVITCIVGAAVPVRRAIVVPSFLANFSAARSGYLDGARVVKAFVDSTSRSKDLHRDVDDPLRADGTDLFALDCPGADPALWVFGSRLTPRLDQRSIGFDLGWDQPYQLVRDARHDRSCAVSA